MTTKQPDRASAIGDSATTNKSAPSEGGSVSQHATSQIIAAKRYPRTRAAARRPLHCIDRARLMFSRAEGNTDLSGAGAPKPHYPMARKPKLVDQHGHEMRMTPRRTAVVSHGVSGTYDAGMLPTVTETCAAALLIGSAPPRNG